MIEIMSATGASRSTIRRDIEQMDKEGLLIRTHGGAKKAEREQTDDIPLTVRQRLYSAEKHQIAKTALAFIEPGDTIFLNAGTTTLELAGLLGVFEDLTIITYDLLIALEVAKTQNRLIVAGGELRKGSATLADTFTLSMMEQFFVKKAFVSADAVDVNRGYMDYNPYEIAIKRKMIENAKISVMLLDHTKFEAQAFTNICGIDDIKLIISDSGLSEKTAEVFRQKGISITIA
jgi:DeoR/GlpR family transcriptional regulator of sugar metabolism